MKKPKGLKKINHDAMFRNSEKEKDYKSTFIGITVTILISGMPVYAISEIIRLVF